MLSELRLPAPKTLADYSRLVALLDVLIDEVGEELIAELNADDQAGKFFCSLNFSRLAFPRHFQGQGKPYRPIALVLGFGARSRTTAE